VFGDHGEAFGQHDGNFGHTFQIYEENVHVPLIVALPGRVHEPVRHASVVSLIDIAPTVLDLIGAPTPPEYEGTSLFDGAPREAMFLADYSLRLVGLRDGRLKMIHEIESGRSQLFDLSTDPGETHDLADRDQDRVRRYARQLEALMR
jgi:arylsulfatase A-like enzyme